MRSLTMAVVQDRHAAAPQCGTWACRLKHVSFWYTLVLLYFVCDVGKIEAQSGINITVTKPSARGVAEGLCAGYGSAPTKQIASGSQPTRFYEDQVESQPIDDWNKKTIEDLASICPMLAGETKLCCTEEQFQEVQKQTSIIFSLVPHCEACLYSLVNTWCQLACHPSNSQFIRVNEIARQNETNADGKFVWPGGEVFDVYWNVTMILSQRHSDAIFNNCIKVRNPLFNTPVFDLLAQGACTVPATCTDAIVVLNGVGQNKFGQAFGSPFTLEYAVPDMLSAEERELYTPNDENDFRCDRQGQFNSCPSNQCVPPDEAEGQESGSGDSEDADSSGSGDGGGEAAVPFPEFLDFMVQNSPGTQDAGGGVPTWLAVAGLVLLVALVLGAVAVMALKRRAVMGHAQPRTSHSAAAGRSRLMDGQLLSNAEHASTEVRHLHLHSASSETGPTGGARGAGAIGGAAGSDWRRRTDPSPVVVRSVRRWLTGLAERVLRGRGPWWTVCVCVVAVAGCSAGLSVLDTETDPERLWASSSSAASVNKAKFDATFGPFYRVEQLILSRRDGLRPVVTEDTLREAIWLQEQVNGVQATSASGAVVSLQDVCWKATRAGCTVMSATEYFQSSVATFDAYAARGLAMQHLDRCLLAPTVEFDDVTWAEMQDFCVPAGQWNASRCPRSMESAPCYSSWQAPINQFEQVFGDFDPEETAASPLAYKNASALVSSMLLLNAEDPAQNADAEAWERAFVQTVGSLAAQLRVLQVAYAAQVSVEDEIDASSRSNATVVAISYAVMLLYVALALTPWRPSESRGRPLAVRSKAGVALAGVLLVLLSVASAVGLFSWCGAQISLITAQVVPFLALAIGVDNVFILTRAVENQWAQQVSETAAWVGDGDISKAFLDSEGEVGAVRLQPSAAPAGRRKRVVAVEGDSSSSSRNGKTAAEKRVFDAERSAEAAAADSPHGQAGKDVWSDACQCVVEAMYQVGPTLALACASEAAAFVVGVISVMPVVQSFAAVSAATVVFNLALQVTVLPLLLALDLARQMRARADLLCCLRVARMELDEHAEEDGGQTAEDGDQAAGSGSVAGGGVYTQALPGGVLSPAGGVSPLAEARGSSPSPSAAALRRESSDGVGPLPSGAQTRGFESAWGRALSSDVARLAVVVLAAGAVVLLVVWVSRLEQGLENKDAMPKGSYMEDYFDAVSAYLSVGPPVYFCVDQAFDYAQVPVQNRFCANYEGCDERSLAQYLRFLSFDEQMRAASFVATAPPSWLDDLLRFGEPVSSCCHVFDNQSYVSLDVPGYEDFALCNAQRYLQPSGGESGQYNTSARLDPALFMPLMDMFLYALAGSKCAISGASAYFRQFNLDGEVPAFYTRESPPPALNDSHAALVTAANYRAFLRPLRTDQDFIDAYKAVLLTNDYIAEATGVPMYPYSPYFVFYEQYLSIVKDSLVMLGAALLAVLVVQLAFFGEPYIPLVVTGNILLIVLAVAGLMYPLGIKLNGLSLVNLVIAAGLSVEFCSHLALAFQQGGRERRAEEVEVEEAEMERRSSEEVPDGPQRVRSALDQMLANLVFGIAATNVIGVSVLVLGDSNVFFRYYFLMYILMVLAGLVVGTVVLPVSLSLLGDVQWMSNRKKEKRKGVTSTA